jgi:hypothetical protein
MLQRLSVILLAAAVFVSNAYCACVAVAEDRGGHPQQVEEPAHQGCPGHGHGSEQQPAEDQHKCGHCTGTVAVGASNGKTTLPGPLLSPIHSFALATIDVTPNVVTSGHAFDHCGLSPPIPPPTLLNLFCSFTN